MPMQELPASLSPREAETMAYEERMFDKQAAFQLRQLEIESKWASWFKIPLTIIKLPVYVLFSIAYIVSVARGKELSENFWRFMR